MESTKVAWITAGSVVIVSLIGLVGTLLANDRLSPTLEPADDPQSVIAPIDDPDPSSIFLSNLSGKGPDPVDGIGSGVIAGQTYNNSVLYIARPEYNVGDGASTTFDLNGRYETFEAVIGLTERPRFEVRFEVYVDDRKVFDRLISDANRGYVVDIDVAGASRMALAVSLVSLIDEAVARDTTIIWGDARLLVARGE